MFYAFTQYNIPVDAYLLESYPEAPPVLYVRPTPSEYQPVPLNMCIIYMIYWCRL
jgi:hypothetical protein